VTIDGLKALNRPHGEERRKRRVSNHEAAPSFETRPTGAPQDEANETKTRRAFEDAAGLMSRQQD
jgi:hypothetical protein